VSAEGTTTFITEIEIQKSLMGIFLDRLAFFIIAKLCNCQKNYFKKSKTLCKSSIKK